MKALVRSEMTSDTGLMRDLVESARRILLVTHVFPDGDAIGSLLGLGELLQAQGKNVTLVCDDPLPEVYAWMPGAAQVLQAPEGAYDLMISLDCSDRRRMGQAVEDYVSTVPLLNIDHHITNAGYGTANWVDPSSVATAQMILEWAESMDWDLTEAVATCLLTGIVTDTRAFRTQNVGAAALRAALRLMEAGASLKDVTRRALEQRPLAATRLWGEAIDRVELRDGILWTEVTQAMRRRWDLDEDGDSGLTNFLSGVREARVVVVFSEHDDGTVDVGMRAGPGYDVAEVATQLGGGGHPQAAGCTLDGELLEVKRRVLALVQQSLEQQMAMAG